MSIFGTALQNTVKGAGALVGKVGSAINRVGQATGNKLPELNVSEKLQYYGSQLNPRTVGASGLRPGEVLGNSTTSDVQRMYDQNNFIPQAPNVVNNNYKPSTGGGGGGGQVLGTSVGSAPVVDSSGGGYQDALKAAYDQARSVYESQFPGIEQDYNRATGDVNAAIERAKGTRDTSLNDVNVGYGDNLRNLVMSDRELGQKSRNLYAGQNALDSSSFLESETKRGQQLFDTQSRIETQKTRDSKDINDQYGAYERQATSTLADLGSQYMSARDSLRQAIASNNIEEAQTIQNYMQQIQSTVGNLKLNLASLQAQGTDVMGSLQKLNRGGIDSILGGYMSNYYNPTMASLTPNSQAGGMPTGSYISPRTGKKYNSYQDFVSAEGN